jgi:hypothetical protein
LLVRKALKFYASASQALMIVAWNVPSYTL